MKPCLAAVLLALGVAAGCGPQSGAPEPSATRPATELLRDTLIMSAVKATLIADDPDSTTSVGVAVRDGVVTLRGRVRDGATRAKLVADTRRSAGVKGVVDQLRVDPNAPRIRQQVGDVALAARVEAAIAAQLGFQYVRVRVERGQATLEGTVPDAKTKTTLLATARGTSGIRNVVDRIRVAGP